MKYIYIYMGIINFLTFLIFGIDKYKAKKDYSRVSEKTLFLLCFIGGGIGGFVGMYTFRHKIRKWYFNLLVPISIVVGVYGGYSIYKVLMSN
ncbi:DUF1294 domain-containing protein [Psychrilyobacter atlanticus]|uniref:DUF1294 domain-containing protein n=1 Tax=Psychrilyobacter atlanticus TaxID=271091 RepID=UPI0004033B4E|nr:DUF1294 domain-containing protein [Psychrilyobacter atlanticus]